MLLLNLLAYLDVHPFYARKRSSRKLSDSHLNICSHGYLSMTNLKAVLGGILFLLSSPSVSHAQPSPKPNIVLIFADDMGWSDTSNSLTNDGHPSDFYETPTLERIASEGMAFTNAYTNGPNCAPTRAALLTGQYAPRPTNNIFQVGDLNRGGNNTPLLGPAQGLPGGEDALPPEAITIAEVLKTAGYATGYVGKFHVATDASDITSVHGFDANFGGQSSGGPGNYFASADGFFGSAIDPTLDAFAAPYTQTYLDNHIKPYTNPSLHPQVEALLGSPKHVTDAVTDAAIHFIEESCGSPLFLFLSHYAVHGPIGRSQARSDLLSKYDAKPIGENQQDTNTGFAALLENMDQSIARLMDYLDTTPDPRNPGQSLAQNTLVLFYSDNGGRQNQSNNGPLKGQKGELTEGGIRVPLIAWSRNSNLVQGGVVNATPVMSIDLFETFRGLAGAQPPPANNPTDGVDLTQVLLNRSDANTSVGGRDLFWHLPGYLASGGRDQRPQSIIRRGRYKLIYNYETETYELYDLEADIGETTNLATNQGMTDQLYQEVESMASSLRAWLIDTAAPLPLVRATGEVVPLPQPFAITEDIVFEFSNSGPYNLNGKTQATITHFGVQLLLEAQGVNAEFATNSLGAGINSTLDDSSGGNSIQRRVDGSLSTPEEFIITFECSVTLSRFATRSNNSDDMLEMRFLSGTNPFTGLQGFNGDGFSLASDHLTYNSGQTSSGPHEIFFTGDGRSPFVIRKGTTLVITTQRASSGGLLFESLTTSSCMDEPQDPDAGVPDGSSDGGIPDSATDDAGVDADSGDTGSPDILDAGSGLDVQSPPPPSPTPSGGSGCRALNSHSPFGVWLLLGLLSVSYLFRCNHRSRSSRGSERNGSC